LGDGGLGPRPNPQSPIPNPQSPIPILSVFTLFKFNKLNFKNRKINNFNKKKLIILL
jgi:hypothetical protein